ncbi:MAG: BTAD domain-containing putative transcriptional regulator [Paracoccaceae bacterium]
MINFQLFGGFRALLDNGRPLRALGRKSECLICLLALSDGLEITREKAAGIIWSDRGEDQARASLRQELSQLRRIIGADAINATKRSIRLVPEHLSVDVLKFREHAVVDTTKTLELAAALYTGPLMAGHDPKSEGFEDWVETERRTLENEALGTTIRLAQHHMNAGNTEQAIKWAEHAIRIDPLREVSHRLVIEALAASGDRTAALAKSAEFAALLHSELGVNPTDAMQALNRSLVSGDSVALTQPASAKAPASPLGGLFKGRAAVAVMPFRCLSAAKGDEYFADGITEDVVNGLAVWRWFPVIGRYTSGHASGDVPTVESVARKSGARYVIGGSVRRSGPRYRVTTELSDAGTGQQLWSQQFDGSAEDIFEIQDRISDEIARRVEPEIRRAESKRLYRKKPSELNIWEILHKARVTKFKNGHTYGSPDDNDLAMTMFRGALARDPSSSDAVSGIATCHWHSALNSWSNDPEKSAEAAIRRAKEAVALDSSNYTALGTVAIVQLFGQHDVPTSEITARKSLDMNPSDILIRHYLVCSLEFAGKFDEAVEQCKYLMALDPQAPSMSVLKGDLSTCLLLGGNAREAVEYSRKSMEADPKYSRGRQRLIAALVAAGDMKDARHEYAILKKAMPSFNLDYVKRTYPFVHDEHLQAYSKYFAAVGAQ